MANGGATTGIARKLAGYRPETVTNPELRAIPGVCEQEHSSGRGDVWADELPGCQIRGWRAVPAAALQGND